MSTFRNEDTLCDYCNGCFVSQIELARADRIEYHFRDVWILDHLIRCDLIDYNKGAWEL